MTVAQATLTGGRRILLAWCAALVAGLGLFHALGAGALAAPPLAPTGWSGWAEGRDPLVATVALLRLVALGLGWYLLVVTTLAVAVRTVRSARLGRVVDAFTLPALRRFLHGALGASVATAIVTAGPVSAGQAARAYAAASEAGPATVMDVLPLDVVGEPGRSAPASDAQGSLGDAPGSVLPLPLELLLGDAEPPTALDEADDADGPGAEEPDDGPGSDDGSGDTDADGAGGAARGGDATERSGTQHAASRDVDAGRASRTIAVAAGDSMWSIARSALSEGGHEPDDGQVASYWSQVVEHNREGLADPDNPDLIFPGDVLVLPELPERRAAGR